jgi:hypothetical protein
MKSISITRRAGLLFAGASAVASRALFGQDQTTEPPPNPAVPLGAVAGHAMVRVISNGSVAEAIGYYPFVDGIGNRLFTGSPGERTAVLSFRTQQFRINLVSNGKVLFIRPAPTASTEGLLYNIYFDPAPRRDFSQPDSFTTGKLVASYRGSAASIISIEESVVSLTASLLLSGSSDFAYDGREHNFGRLAKAIHVRATGPSPTLEQLSGGSLISIPLGGALIAAAAEPKS